MRTENDFNISINQLAAFFRGTPGKKRGIIKQQKNPNPLKVFWYQLAKARIRKMLAKRGDIQPILEGIEELKSRKLSKKRQIDDRTVSLEAMQKFIEMKLPKALQGLNYEVMKRNKIKSIYVKGVELIVSPDLIISFVVDGKRHLGAIKIHIAKHSQFDSKQQSLISAALQKYLEKVVAKGGDVVLPEFCLSIDIFSGEVISAPKNIDEKFKDIEVMCEEVKTMWRAA